MPTQVSLHPRGEIQVLSEPYSESGIPGQCWVELIGEGVEFTIHGLTAEAMQKLAYDLLDASQRLIDHIGRTNHVDAAAAGEKADAILESISPWRK